MSRHGEHAQRVSGVPATDSGFQHVTATPLRVAVVAVNAQPGGARADN